MSKIETSGVKDDYLLDGVISMKRWNGWGDSEFDYPVDDQITSFIEERIGPPAPFNDASLESICSKVPPSRLADALNKEKKFLVSIFSLDKEIRVKHSYGQSLLDWIDFKYGTLEIFPDAVAFPHGSVEVVELLAFAAKIGARVIPYGGGSSVVGHLKPEKGDSPIICVDMSRMNRRIGLDTTSLTATFQAGIMGPDLEASLQSEGYTLGHYPQSFEFSSLGGWVASRSSGQFSRGYGRIDGLFLGGRVETPAGTIELPVFPASAAGPDLKEIVLGSEGRLGIITRCTVKISRLPAKQKFVGVFFKDDSTGLEAARKIAASNYGLTMMRLSFGPETETMLKLSGKGRSLEILEKYLGLRGIKGGKSMMLYGCVGDKDQVATVMKKTAALISRHGGISAGQTPGTKWYHKRFQLPYLRNTLWERGYAIDTLETAVTWDKVETVRDAMEKATKDAADAPVHIFTHLSHLYPQGSSVYTTYLFKLSGDAKKDRTRWLNMKTAASKAIVKCGGTISHQHGVGIDHKPYLEAEKGALGIELLSSAMRSLDPNAIMNPGKLF
jgi:alkyldihydroxyacetonephosphate synthase